MSKKPALLLLPNLLGEHAHHEVFLPNSVDRAVETIDGLISESVGGGRRFLSRFKTPKPAHEIPIALLNEHTPDADLDFLLEPIIKGERWGLVSDSGLPCMADPGAKLVARARQRGLPVQAFVGPSSLTLGLMLSGLPSQCFAFHGYISRDASEQKQQLQLWEKRSKQEQATQIFIETPYRAPQVLQSLISTLSDSTLLCVASELTSPSQMVVTQSIATWKKMAVPNLLNKPTIFLFSAH